MHRGFLEEAYLAIVAEAEAEAEEAGESETAVAVAATHGSTDETKETR